jgi:hypothetical protein
MSPRTLTRISGNDKRPIPHMTVRFIYIESILSVDEYKRKKGSEKFSIEYINEKLYPKMDKAIGNDIPLEFEFERDVLHEYVHDLLFRNTSLFINFNLCATVFRFNVVYLAERMVSVMELDHDIMLEELLDSTASDTFQAYSRS